MTLMCSAGLFVSFFFFFFADVAVDWGPHGKHRVPQVIGAHVFDKLIEHSQIFDLDY